MEIEKVLIPLGVVSYIIFFSTALSGLLRWNLKYHKALALTAIILATIHIIIIFTLN